jgi:hypothetical protein
MKQAAYSYSRILYHHRHGYLRALTSTTIRHWALCKNCTQPECWHLVSIWSLIKKKKKKQRYILNCILPFPTRTLETAQDISTEFCLALSYRDGFLPGWFLNLKMEVALCSEALVHMQNTRHYVPENGNFQKEYIFIQKCLLKTQLNYLCKICSRILITVSSYAAN